MPTDLRLLSLLHLCDSLFPTGSFAHSDGLEAATAAGLVATVDDLREWVKVCLDENLGHVEGPAVWLAHGAYRDGSTAALMTLDDELNALRPSSTARAASRAMGTRLLKTWTEVHGGSPIYGDRAASLPIAFAIVCASIGIEVRETVEAFIYTRLAGAVSSSMRLMPIGQRDAHTLLAQTLTRVPATLDAIAGRCERGEPLGVFAPAFDIAVMAQQHVRSRLFLS